MSKSNYPLDRQDLGAFMTSGHDAKTRKEEIQEPRALERAQRRAKTYLHFFDKELTPRTTQRVVTHITTIEIQGPPHPDYTEL